MELVNKIAPIRTPRILILSLAVYWDGASTRQASIKKLFSIYGRARLKKRQLRPIHEWKCWVIRFYTEAHYHGEGYGLTIQREDEKRERNAANLLRGATLARDISK
jgi:hypothetical protein